MTTLVSSRSIQKKTKVFGTPPGRESLHNSWGIWDMFPFVFRINDNSFPGQTTLTILERVCKERGWKEFGEVDDKVYGRNLLGWNLWWKSVVLLGPQSRSLYSWQYTNHIPRAIHFCNKEYLAGYVSHMEELYGDIFKFCPKSFTIPREMERLEDEHDARLRNYTSTAMNYCTSGSGNVFGGGGGGGDVVMKNDEAASLGISVVWICKPLGKSQGKGIVLIDNLTNLPDHPVTVVQEYISKPLLISGYKFDLRLYITIVSVSPLTIYVYREGLTRFSTEQYDLNNLQNVCSHLTNVSLNKLSPGYEKDKDTVGHGCKWSLRKLRKHLQEQGHTDWFLWQKIMSIIVLTILGEVGHRSQAILYSSRSSFEFLGYDILVDSDLRPWLLETNLSPGLGGDCAIDETVKRPMLHDLFDLLGLPDYRRVWGLKEKGGVKAGSNEEGCGNCNSDEISRIQSQLQFCADPRSGQKYQVNLTEVTEPSIGSRRNHERKCKSTTKLSSSLQARLHDAQNIYSRNCRRRVEIKTCKTSPSRDEGILAELPFNSNEFLQNWLDTHSSEQGDHMSCKRASGLSSCIQFSTNEMGNLTRRNWYNAPERHGDWIRVFPFNSNHFQSRGLSGTNTKTIIKNLQEFLTIAEILCKTHPNQSDDYYNSKIHESMCWNKNIWMPPI